MSQTALWITLHGSTIGVTLFVVLIVGGFLLWPGVKRALIHVRARRLRAGLGEPLSEGFTHREGALVTLSGRLEIGGHPLDVLEGLEDVRGAAAATLERSPEQAKSRQRADELWLEVAGERVELDGEVDVVVGSREIYPPRSTELPLEEKSEELLRLVALRWIDGGQRVRVRGALERVPTGSEDGSYRTAAPSRFALVPDHSGQEDAVLRLAAEGAPRVNGSPWRLTSIWVALGVGGASVFISALLLGLVGSTALHVAQREVSFTAAALASTMPKHRDRALRWMTDTLEESLDQDDREIESYILLCILRHDEHRAFRRLMEREHFGHAASVAHELGDIEGLRSAALSLARRGQFEAASRWFEASRALSNQRHASGWRDEVLAHLLAGRLEPAADVAALEAQRDGGHRQCIADALAAGAGDERALARLVERASLGAELAECQILRAELVPPEASVALLPRCEECMSNSRWARVVWLLQYEALLMVEATDAERASVAEEASSRITTTSCLIPRLNLHVPGLEQSLLHDLGGAPPESLLSEERLLLERLAQSVGDFDQLLLSTSLLPASPPDEGLWSPLWPDPVETMWGLSAHYRMLTSDRDPRADAVEQALESYHEALSRRETAVLIDIFAAW